MGDIPKTEAKLITTTRTIVTDKWVKAHKRFGPRSLARSAFDRQRPSNQNTYNIRRISVQAKI